MTPRTRLATVEDIPEIVRLAEVMYTSMGFSVDDRWREVAASMMAARLGHDVAGFVVEQDAVSGTGGPAPLASSGLAVICHRLPGPTRMTGTYAYIQWVATDPAWRGRGCARAMMTALVAWCREQDVSVVELHATPSGEPLYRSLGFTVGANVGLRLSL